MFVGVKVKIIKSRLRNKAYAYSVIYIIEYILLYFTLKTN